MNIKLFIAMTAIIGIALAMSAWLFAIDFVINSL